MTKTKYEEYSLNISDNQKEKIQRALKNNEGVTIRIDDVGDDKITLTQAQVNKINKAFQNGKSLNIKLSKAQLEYNKNKVEGGFLGPLLAMARTALPGFARAVLPGVGKALGIGALTGVASNLVNKIMGNGLYLKRGGCDCSGLYLSPKNTNELQKFGDGVFVKDNGNWCDGSGVTHEIFKNIPLLNMLF